MDNFTKTFMDYETIAALWLRKPSGQFLQMQDEASSP